MRRVKGRNKNRHNLPLWSNDRPSTTVIEFHMRNMFETTSSDASVCEAVLYYTEYSHTPSIVARLKGWMLRGSNPSRCKRFISSPKRPDRIRAHPASCSVCTVTLPRG